MRIWMQKSASMQKRTSPLKFGDLAEKSGLNSVSNLSTKLLGSINEHASVNPYVFERDASLVVSENSSLSLSNIAKVKAIHVLSLNGVPQYCVGLLEMLSKRCYHLRLK